MFIVMPALKLRYNRMLDLGGEQLLMNKELYVRVWVEHKKESNLVPPFLGETQAKGRAEVRI